jgi:hypothetical protein
MIPDHKGMGLSRRETVEIMLSRSLRAQGFGFSVGLSSEQEADKRSANRVPAQMRINSVAHALELELE